MIESQPPSGRILLRRTDVSLEGDIKRMDYGEMDRLEHRQLYISRLAVNISWSCNTDGVSFLPSFVDVSISNAKGRCLCKTISKESLAGVWALSAALNMALQLFTRFWFIN
jgi:hypothetical protein